MQALVIWLLCFGISSAQLQLSKPSYHALKKALEGRTPIGIQSAQPVLRHLNVKPREFFVLNFNGQGYKTRPGADPHGPQPHNAPIDNLSHNHIFPPSHKTGSVRALGGQTYSSSKPIQPKYPSFHVAESSYSSLPKDSNPKNKVSYGVPTSYGPPKSYGSPNSQGPLKSYGSPKSQGPSKSHGSPKSYGVVKSIPKLFSQQKHYDSSKSLGGSKLARGKFLGASSMRGPGFDPSKTAIYRNEVDNIDPISEREDVKKLTLRRQRRQADDTESTDDEEDYDYDYEEDSETQYLETLPFALSSAGSLFGGAVGRYLDTTNQAGNRLIRSMQTLSNLAISQLDNFLDQNEEKIKEREEARKAAYAKKSNAST